MSSHARWPEELSVFEQALAGLSPAPSRIDRDRLMFELGVQAATEQLGANQVPQQRHGRAPAHFWAAAAVLLACTSLGLGILLAVERRHGENELPVAHSSDPTPVLPATSLQSIPATFAGDAGARKTPTLFRSADEQWLMALASPATRVSAALRLRPPSLHNFTETSVALTVPAAQGGPAGTKSNIDEHTGFQSAPRRLNDRRQWLNWLDATN